MLLKQESGASALNIKKKYSYALFRSFRLLFKQNFSLLIYMTI